MQYIILAEMPTSMILPYLVRILGLNTAVRPLFNMFSLFEQVGLDHLTMCYFCPIILTTNRQWGFLEHPCQKTAGRMYNI